MKWFCENSGVDYKSVGAFLEPKCWDAGVKDYRHNTVEISGILLKIKDVGNSFGRIYETKINIEKVYNYDIVDHECVRFLHLYSEIGEKFTFEALKVEDDSKWSNWFNLFHAVGTVLSFEDYQKVEYFVKSNVQTKSMFNQEFEI